MMSMDDIFIQPKQEIEMNISNFRDVMVFSCSFFRQETFYFTLEFFERRIIGVFALS